MAIKWDHAELSQKGGNSKAVKFDRVKTQMFFELLE